MLPKAHLTSHSRMSGSRWVITPLWLLWSSHHSQQKSPKCSTWMQSPKRQNDLCSFPRQTIQYYGNPSLCLTSNTEEAEAEQFYEDLQDFLELTLKKRCPFHYKGLECKSRKSRNTWSNRQIWPWSTEWSRAKANRVLPREGTGRSKYPLPTTQQKTLHMDHLQMVNTKIRLYSL